MTAEQKRDVEHTLRLNKPNEAHHGDCKGADKQFHDIAKSFGYEITVHPPIDDKKRAFCKGDYSTAPKEYLARNKDIVDACDILIATPKSAAEEVRSGTWSTIRYAKKTHKRGVIIFPDGKIKTF